MSLQRHKVAVDLFSPQLPIEISLSPSGPTQERSTAPSDTLNTRTMHWVLVTVRSIMDGPCIMLLKILYPTRGTRTRSASSLTVPCCWARRGTCAIQTVTTVFILLAHPRNMYWLVNPCRHVRWRQAELHLMGWRSRMGELCRPWQYSNSLH